MHNTTHTTTFTFYLPPYKVKYLSEKFNQDKMTIISQNEEQTEIQLKINGGMDIIDIFYAGVFAGMDAMRENINK